MCTALSCNSCRRGSYAGGYLAEPISTRDNHNIALKSGARIASFLFQDMCLYFEVHKEYQFILRIVMDGSKNINQH